MNVVKLMNHVKSIYYLLFCLFFKLCNGWILNIFLYFSNYKFLKIQLDSIFLLSFMFENIII